MQGHCESCRSKKLRCDRGQPSCMACVAAGVPCVMRSSCPPRGPKKGHLKEIRNQILALETRLNEQQELGASDQRPRSRRRTNSSNSEEDGNNERSQVTQTSPIPATALTPVSIELPPWSAPMSNFLAPTATMEPVGEDNSQAMISAGLERVPVALHLTAIMCSDLDQLYFDRVHNFAPMLQRFRYLLWSKQPNKSRGKICLQYAMWTLAAALSSQFQFLRGELYTEARQSLDALEMENPDMCIERVQAWLLLSLYEFMSDLYQRGLVSVGRAFRLVQLMRLHEIDKLPITGGQGDLIDIESIRRTFWMAYTIDRFTSAQDNLSLAINEKQIRTRLPAPHSQFMSGRPATMCFLSEVIAGIDSEQPNNTTTDLTMCPFTQSIIVATMCGRALGLKQRFVSQQAYQDVITEFYLRHRNLNTFLTARIKILSMQISSTSEHPDALLLFSTLAAYMIVFMLYETIETIPMGTEESHTLLLGHEQRSLDAVHELDVLTSMLTQVNHFQMHPFTPIPLLLSVRYCLSHVGSNDAYSNLVISITRALESLSFVNSLAQNSLRALGMNVPNFRVGM
ncbi:hypothetical protein K505DRAFT_410481 [Melanomma pulvis-pyrius CBS 109.77]|uniref:Zn(2)-C6 fungal-type domain-containing protein n=1 Tax=Melanomma pulvis-pyrius CBS 109.77 TaxID=1314802 RepID=A0A6A6WYZ4_9PLEO|nr:hypothetical protein K505DRAFT_410481 [Melanomma pulvis-pyrius CBS 109.77]